MLHKLPHLVIRAIDVLNRRGKSVAVRLTRYTGKSRHFVHPKHLAATPWHDWYFEQLRPGDIALDVGCANGAHTLRAALHCKRVFGLDYDLGQLRVAGREAGRLGVGNVHLFAWDITARFPFPDRYFDVVLFLDVIEHLLPRVRVLGEIRRVLKDEGRLLISGPNRETSPPDLRPQPGDVLAPAAPGGRPLRLLRPRSQGGVHPDGVRRRAHQWGLRAQWRADAGGLRHTLGRAHRRAGRDLTRTLRAPGPLETRGGASASRRKHGVPGRGDKGRPVTIFLVNEYFPPYAPGGAEWSTEALARALATRGHRVVVITPNYGAAPREDRNGFTIVRFPFPIKRQPGRAVIPAGCLANPFFYLYAGMVIGRLARREKAVVLHAQNKHMLVPGVIARALTGLPLVLTIRDGSIINAAPLCLHHGDQMPPDCGVRKLWRECSEEYFALYVKDPRRRLRSKLAFLYF
ncbi:MAG: group 1 glycosyl transferase, partial [bacterium]